MMRPRPRAPLADEGLFSCRISAGLVGIQRPGDTRPVGSRFRGDVVSFWNEDGEPLVRCTASRERGLFQFSSTKSVCLKHCRTPVGFLLSERRNIRRSVLARSNAKAVTLDMAEKNVMTKSNFVMLAGGSKLKDRKKSTANESLNTLVHPAAYLMNVTRSYRGDILPLQPPNSL
jgi:hypothetical protein